MKYFIFDMDGTLYQFEKGTFTSTEFYRDLKKNIINFFKKNLKFNDIEANQEYDKIDEEFNGEVSLYLENKYNIDRYRYFDSIWNLSPENYIEKNDKLVELFSKLDGRVVVLTAAPRVWAEKVLKHLGIYEIVKDSLFTGEGNLRKPEIFSYFIKYFNTNPENIYSIGDQEYSDIIPAKKLGMKTVIIGSKSKYADFEIQTLDDLYKEKII